MTEALSQLRDTRRRAADIYHQRAGMAYYAYVRRDAVEQLRTRAGRENPYKVYDRIRAGGPISKARLIEWMSPSWELCRQVLRDRRFGMHPPDLAVRSEDFMLSFLEMNPPDHTRLRRVVAPAFGPRQMTNYRARIDKAVGQMLDAVQGRPFDLVGDFAAPLPITVIADLLGVPEDRSGDFAKFGATLGTSLDGLRSLRHARELEEANAELERLFVDLFRLRRREPTDDIVSAIVAAEGSEVTPGEMVPLCTLLLLAGFETTTNMIGNGMLALLEHRDQWEALCADPSLSPGATEEALRYDGPVQRASRFALEDVEIQGVTVRKGERIVNLIGAANRDPEHFDAPDDLDITRSNAADHLAFSAGIHFCPGHALARLEGEIAFAALAERLPGLRLAGKVVRRASTTIRGPIQMPVTA